MNEGENFLTHFVRLMSTLKKLLRLKSEEKMNTWFRDMPDRFITRDVCKNVVEKYAWMLEYVPEQFKTRVMCKNAFEIDPDVIAFIPDRFKTQDM